MRDLGTLDGVTGTSEANGINGIGQVAGYSGTAEGGTHAFIIGPDGDGPQFSDSSAQRVDSRTSHRNQ
nr:hypothetical protein [Nitrosospira sp. Nsp14]